MISKMMFSALSHELHTAASNGVLDKAIKTLVKKYPQYKSIILAKGTTSVSDYYGIEYSFSKINEVAQAFKANRAAAGIKEPYNWLV